jgi:hypothetical protein
MPKGKITERSLYPFIIEIIENYGGSGISEVKFDSEPDIIFELLNIKWLMPVKIGEDTKIIKDNFVSYSRHRRESGINSGILLFFPSDIRSIKPKPEFVRKAIYEKTVTCLVDAQNFQTEVRDTLPEIIKFVIEKLREKVVGVYPLCFVVSLLKQHIEDMMSDIKLSEPEILKIITDLGLFFGIGAGILKERKEEALRFLASYIIISQLLFLRFYSEAKPEIMEEFTKPKKEQLRKVFQKICDINYRPIYEIDVLDSIPEEYISDTFELIQGLRIEKQRYEIPGRLFHELMPKMIRKMLAGFYTRPQSAELLANLAIESGDDTVFDPACGSGTILTSAYKRKKELYTGENPHRQFCENDIFGSDIMPFAVHLTCANLASLDVFTTIDRTQITNEDSLKLFQGRLIKSGIRERLFQEESYAYRRTGEKYEITLDEVKAVLMNPPFTKIERGIAKYIDMTKFRNVCGGEVGLWGHFVILADQFLENRGILSAILPINLLRGRESKKVRDFVFSNWHPLYILKPTFNYGFTEWTEYRDIILVAKKERQENYMVKFCLIKKDLCSVNHEDIKEIAEGIKTSSKSDILDVRTFSWDEMREHFDNLMWFCGVSDFEHRDILVKFLEKFNLEKFSDGYFREGYRPVPEGVSSFMFVTRALNEARAKKAFLILDKETKNYIHSKTQLGTKFILETSSFLPSLRTGIGLETMDIKNKLDYIACKSYNELNNVLRACKFKNIPEGFWENVENELEEVKTNLVVARRINPFSPNTHLIAFYSDEQIFPSNQLNVIKEGDKETAKAVCTLLNSAIFLAYFFLLKEETTGRYIDVRFYDLEQMKLYPTGNVVKKLVKVFDNFSLPAFPSLREQLDLNFVQRYKSFWKEKREGVKQLTLFKLEHEPYPLRLNFDLEVCKALDVPIEKEELIKIYDTIVKEMIMTRGLRRD